MAEDQLFLLDMNFFSQNILFSEENIYTYFKNLEGQATSLKENICQISNVIPLTVDHFKKSSGDVSNYIAIFLIRQIITEFKNTHIYKMPILLKKFSLVCVHLGFIKTLVALKAIYKVFYFKVYCEKK
jgi:hypothetical protein